MKSAAQNNHDQAMMEYLNLLPFFYNEIDDDQPCIPCQGAAPSEEIWKKFELIPTPPLSPEHDGSVDSDSDSEVGQIFNTDTTETLAQVSDCLGQCNDPPMTDTTSNFDATSNNCTEGYEDQSSGQKLIKDCMWNGSGHKPHSEVPRRWRDDSPATVSLLPANGFVDPRSVFPEQKCEVGGRLSALNPATMIRRRSDGSDSPSDSDEEIDVVTVEKASPNKTPTTTNSTTTLGVLSQGRKVVGTLVSRLNGPHRQLALVTSNANRIRKRANDGADKENKLKTKFQVSKTERNGQQTVTMVINNVKSGADGTTKPVNFQLKTLPVMTTSVGSNGLTTKRRFTSPSNAATSVASVMRLSTSSSNIINGPPPAKKVRESQPTVAATNISQSSSAKRPVLSLQGISMVTDTGVMRNKSDLSPPVKKEQLSTPHLHPTGEQVFVVSTGNPETLTEKRKMTKKATKAKPVTVPAVTYDTPANSPVSSAGESNPCSPRKQRVISGESTASSSGSDEEIRAAHNVLERQRREGLRASFHTLRKCVPELADTERAPKVHILKKAKEYSLQLQDEQMSLEVEKAGLHERNVYLHQKLRELLNEISSVQPVSLASPVKCERAEAVHRSSHFSAPCNRVVYSSDDQDCSDGSESPERTDAYYQDVDVSSEEEEETMGSVDHLSTAVYVSAYY
uniref:Myc n=1 Tax=Phallusia mammillata TaxID=59560 RepID=A0A6F9DM38_9ASCI|nr:Myc [Phallusia mammillata]